MTTTSFLGIPVDGDIVRPKSEVPQRPLADLAPMLQAVLDDETIAAFGWRQYTPYFNDGDPCVFGVSGVWFARPEDLPADGHSDADEFEDGDEFDKDDLTLYSDHLGGYSGGEWVPDPENARRQIRIGDEYEGPDQARYDRCQALDNAIDSDAFDAVLLEAFGDHAEITVKRDGITVEFYEHD